MAAAHLSPPENEFGPCEECEHKGCASVRAVAASVCTLCGEKIGYERRYYNDDEYGNKYDAVHATCLEERIL